MDDVEGLMALANAGDVDAAYLLGLHFYCADPGAARTNQKSRSSFTRLLRIAPPARFERATFGLGSRCSILLSYGGGGGDRSAPSEGGNAGTAKCSWQPPTGHRDHRFSRTLALYSAPLRAKMRLREMPSEVPVALNLSFYALLIWGLSAVLTALRILVHSDRAGLLARGALFAWLGVPALLAMAGLFASFEAVPPPLMPLVAIMSGLVLAFSFSPFGLYAAERLPASFLVGLQGFRFPLEIVLYGLAARQILPKEMTFAGYNFDILTGIAALFLWRAVRRGGVPRWVLWLYNSLGLCLLALIGTVAVLGFPQPFGWFEPQNRLIAFYPWVLLPTFLVQLALLGHLLLFRKLLAPEPVASPNM